MDEWVDNTRGTNTGSLGQELHQASLMLSPRPPLGELPAGKGACRALTENAFGGLGPPSVCTLTDGMLGDSWKATQAWFHSHLNPWRQGKEGPKMCSSTPPA